MGRGGARGRRVPLQLQGVEEALADLPDGAVVLGVLRHLPQQFAHRLLQLVHRLEVRPAAVQDPCGHRAPAMHTPPLWRQVAPSRSPTLPSPAACRGPGAAPVATEERCRDMRRRGRLSPSGRAGAAHPSRRRRARRPGRGTRSGGCRRRTPWRGEPAPRSRRRSKPEGTAGAAGKEADGRHCTGAAGRCSPGPTAPARYGAGSEDPGRTCRDRSTGNGRSNRDGPKTRSAPACPVAQGKTLWKNSEFCSLFKNRVSSFKPQSRHCRLGLHLFILRRGTITWTPSPAHRLKAEELSQGPGSAAQQLLVPSATLHSTHIGPHQKPS